MENLIKLNKRSKIIITGATGLIGSALIKHLQSNGYENVIGLSSNHVNLTDYSRTLAVFEEIKPELVFHLAARVYGIMGNMLNKGIAFLDNLRINTNVIEASRAVNVKKIIAMGSAAIYSDKVTMPMSEDQIWDGAPHHSEGPYAHAKRTMLAQLEVYREQYGIEYAFCVSTNLFGPCDKFDERYGHVIPSLICKFHRAIRTGGPLEIWGTGNPTRDFLYSADAAEAMILISEQLQGSINLASGISYPIRRVVEILKDITKYQGDIIWDQTKPDGQKMRQYDINKLTNLGFKSHFTLEQGLVHTFDWYCKNYANVRR